MTAVPDSATVAPSDTRRASWASATVVGLLATLEEPLCWAVALAGFLSRGGVLVFGAAIVVLPTPAGIQAVVAPLLVPVIFGQLPIGLIILAGALAGLLAASLVLGGLIGGWADVFTTRRIGAAMEHGVRPGASGDQFVIAFMARLLAHLPLAAAMGWGAYRLVDAAYAELVTPFEVVTPLVVRVVAGAPDAVALILATWLLGEVAGGLAVREIVLGGRPLIRAVLRGWLSLAQRPLSSAATLLIGNGVVLVAILPALAASMAAWARMRSLLYEGGAAEGILLSLVVFVALWLGGLLLAAVATAARSSLWTVEWVRRATPGRVTMSGGNGEGAGTIGADDGTDRGGWPTVDGSGSL